MTQEDFVNCPYCGTVLKKQCTNCQKLVDMEWSYCPYCGQVAAKPITKTVVKPVTALEPTTIQELKDQQELAQIKSNPVEQARLERAQKATFSSAIGITPQHKDRITNASQSALSLLRQTFGSSARPASTDLESSLVAEPADETPAHTEEEAPQAKAVEATTTKAPTKKRATKGRTTRRAKK